MSFLIPDTVDQQLALKKVDDALKAVLKESRAPCQLSPTLVDPRAISRNNFLFICNENGSIYESARRLINNDAYWKLEEDHFYTLDDLIRPQSARGPSCSTRGYCLSAC